MLVGGAETTGPGVVGPSVAHETKTRAVKTAPIRASQRPTDRHPLKRATEPPFFVIRQSAAPRRLVRPLGQKGTSVRPPSKPEAIDWTALLAGLPQPGPGLHIVSTPIGNLSDLSLRALKTLMSVDAVLCEDTRVTARLFARYGIDQSLSPYHDHNAATARPKIIERLKAGESLALVSDAGTPLISDPGYKLVREAAAACISVSAVPGPSAALMGLTLSGLPTDQFYFMGFLPAKEGARRRSLQNVASVQASLVIYEGASRLGASLSDMAEVLGNREAAIARELTKLHEEVLRGRLLELAERFAATPPKGELVIIVAPPSDEEARDAAEDRLDEALRTALQASKLKTAVAEVAANLGLPRKQVYARALALSEAES